MLRRSSTWLAAEACSPQSIASPGRSAAVIQGAVALFVVVALAVVGWISSELPAPWHYSLNELPIRINGAGVLESGVLKSGFFMRS